MEWVFNAYGAGSRVIQPYQPGLNLFTDGHSRVASLNRQTRTRSSAGLGEISLVFCLIAVQSFECSVQFVQFDEADVAM